MFRGPLAVLAVTLAAAPAPAQDPVRALEQQVRKLIEAAEPSVVAVVATQLKYPGEAPDPKQPGRLGGYAPPRINGLAPPGADPRLDLSDPERVGDHRFGSGLVLDRDAGLILTNYHLVTGATKVFVRSLGGRGSYADVHAFDARSDLAVLKLIDPLPGLEPVRFATVRAFDGPGDQKATLFRGMFVVALGHPLAIGFSDGVPSASWGILSNLRRRSGGPGREDQRNKALHQYGVLLQTDARLTLGTSGGGLFDLDGKLIGMTAPLAAVSGADAAGGFAVPFDRNFRRIVEVLKQGKEVEYGFLGVAFGADPGEPRDPRRGPAGVRVGSVTPGGPAARAGLLGDDRFRDGADVITAIDGQPVREPDDLFLYVGSALAGTSVRLTFLRNGRPMSADVTLAKFYHPLPWLASRPPDDVFGLRTEYTSVGFLKNGGGGGRVGLLPGVAVREIDPDTPAAAKFAALGGDPTRWLVTAVDGAAVNTPAEFTDAAAGKLTVRLRLLDPNPGAGPRDRTVTLP